MSDKCWICGQTKHTGGCGCNSTFKSDPPQTTYRRIPYEEADALDEKDQRIASLEENLRMLNGLYEEGLERERKMREEIEELKRVASTR